MSKKVFYEEVYEDFLRRGAIQRGDGPNDVRGESLSRRVGGGRISCLRLHFDRFDKLSTSQTFNLQKYFFASSGVLYLPIF